MKTTIAKVKEFLEDTDDTWLTDQVALTDWHHNIR